MINLMLKNGIFHEREKEACVKSTSKNSLDHQKLVSNRPASNLSFLSKMIELTVQKQLIKHVERIKVLPENLSACRKYHSTEAALCGFMSDMLSGLDSGKCGILILLDLSAAFDTVEHGLLLSDLINIGIDGDVLEWFKSYLINRTYYVYINSIKSDSIRLSRGVLQGSVLGPTLFSIYTIELS